MASTTDKPAPEEPEKVVASAPPPPPADEAPPVEEKAPPPPEAPAPEGEKVAPQPEEAPPPAAATTPKNPFVLVDVVLRTLLFVSTLTAVVVMVTSKQTKVVPVPRGVPSFSFGGVARVSAKFNHSPAFIYFVAALSVACLYSLITTLVSFLAILKPGSSSSTKLLVHFVIVDVLMLGIVASATGTAGGVAYIGLKGNSHVGWNKVCNNYDIFCQHVGGSIAVSLFASCLLVLLVLLSVYSLSKKIPK